MKKDKARKLVKASSWEDHPQRGGGSVVASRRVGKFKMVILSSRPGFGYVVEHHQDHYAGARTVGYYKTLTGAKRAATYELLGLLVQGQHSEPKSVREKYDLR